MNSIITQIDGENNILGESYLGEGRNEFDDKLTGKRHQNKMTPPSKCTDSLLTDSLLTDSLLSNENNTTNGALLTIGQTGCGAGCTLVGYILGEAVIQHGMQSVTRVHIGSASFEARRQ